MGAWVDQRISLNKGTNSKEGQRSGEGAEHGAATEEKGAHLGNDQDTDTSPRHGPGKGEGEECVREAQGEKESYGNDDYQGTNTKRRPKVGKGVGSREGARVCMEVGRNPEEFPDKAAGEEEDSDQNTDLTKTFGIEVGEEVGPSINAHLRTSVRLEQCSPTRPPSRPFRPLQLLLEVMRRARGTRASLKASRTSAHVARAKLGQGLLLECWALELLLQQGTSQPDNIPATMTERYLPSDI